MSESYVKLDPVVWAAHFQCRLPEEAGKLAVVVPVSRGEWTEYWRQTRIEARGCWHGATGVIAERLGVSEEEWLRMVRFHQPEPPGCLGDSSHDYSYLIEAAALFPSRERNYER